MFGAFIGRWEIILLLLALICFVVVVVAMVIGAIFFFKSRPQNAKGNESPPAAPFPSAPAAPATQIFPAKCPQCGTALPSGALAGLCPACMLKMGAATDTVTDAKQPPFHPPGVAELAAKFPQLEILELIGKGGMGAVYKARQKQLDRIVALKILPPGIGHDAAFAERFAREAKALAKLNHPNIVTLYEFGDASGQFYFLMEFVDGVNLRQLLHNSRIAPREALAIVPQICDALQFAHDQGIVHRDIKPENILMDRRGRVKVADFGLAKIIGVEKNEPGGGGNQPGASPMTEAGKVMGTPQYMSPEQITAPGEVDHRADIYALGVVFYQMLTGELPGKKIEAPSKKVQIDVRLDEIVLRALEKKPELRYQRVSEVKTCVETIVANPPGSGKTGSAPARPTSKGVFIGLAFLFSFIVFINFVLTLWFGAKGNAPVAVMYLSAAFSSGVVAYIFARRARARRDAGNMPPSPPIQKPDRFWRWFAVAVFAFISIPVVIAIIGLLAAIAIPNFIKARAQAQENARHAAQLAKGSTADFYIGQTNFPKGDDIEITSVERTANQMTVKGRYNLVSADNARLALNITTTNVTFAPEDPKQSIEISKGRGDFELVHPHVVAGLPHVNMYPVGGGGPFAEIYFGAEAEAAAERKLHLNTPPASAETWSPTLAPGEKPDVSKIWNDAKDLMEQGKYEEALQRLIWYFNHALEYDQGQTGVRLSFALSQWVELGRRYPKAKQALLEIRDRDAQLLASGQGYAKMFMDVNSINNYLGQEDATLALFKQMYENDPKLAGECFYYAEDLLLKKGEYALLLKCVGEPQAHFESARRGFEVQIESQQRMAEMRKRHPMPAGAPAPTDFSKFATNNFVGQVCKLVEILVATGHQADAEKIQNQAIAVLDDARLKSAVSHAEKKTQQPAAAQPLSFGPVMVRNLTNEAMLDFDSGKVITEVSKPMVTQDIRSVFELMSKAGLDFGYFLSNGTFTVGMKIKILNAADWTNMTGNTLAYALAETPDYDQTTAPDATSAGGLGYYESNTLVVYGFQTRKGSIGLVQITGLPENPRGLKIYYKLVQNGDVAKSSPMTAVQNWLALMDTGAYPQSWETAADSFHKAMGKDAWVKLSERVRQPLGKVISRKEISAQSPSVLPGMPAGSYFIAQFETSYAALTNAVETVEFEQEKNGEWKAISYLIRPRTDEQTAAVTAAQKWLAGIDAGHYAESWTDASESFQGAITQDKWVAAMKSVRGPLGKMQIRTVDSAVTETEMPGAPDGKYVVMQFETAFVKKNSAMETVTFVLEKDGQWKASGYYIK